MGICFPSYRVAVTCLGFLFCISAALLTFTCFPSFQLEKMRNIIPFDQMTLEDLNEVFPETKLDKKKYPYWPHRPVESL